MKKIIRVILVVLVLASLITSCSKPGAKQAKYIPKDAYIVYGINSKNIVQKIAKANISFDSLARMLSGGNDSETTRAITKFNDIKNSGIDLDQEIFGFVKSGGSIMSGQSFSMGIVGVLKDVPAFEAFVKKENPDEQIKKADNYSYISIGQGFVAGWSDNIVIVTTANPVNPSAGSDATSEATSSQQLLTSLFAQKESESISSVKAFNDVVNENTDMMFFANSASSQSTMSFLAVTKFADLIKDSYITGTANFEDGKITASFASHSNQAMIDLLKKFPSRNIDMSMLDKYPSAINAFMAISFDPQLITAILKFSGMDVLANQTLQQFGANFTLDDITKAFKGDFVVIASDFGIEEKTVSDYGGIKLPKPIVSKQPVYKLLFNASIGDKASYDKVVTGLASKNIMVLQNGQYVFPQMGEYVMKATNNNLYISSVADLLQQYEAGASNKANLPGDVHDKVKGKSVGFYLDLNKLMNVIPAASDDIAEVDSAKATFKDIVFYGDNLAGDVSKGTMELRFMNDKENSLVTLARFLVAESKMDMERRKVGGMSTLDQVETDSTTMAPAPPAPPSK